MLALILCFCGPPSPARAELPEWFTVSPAAPLTNEQITFSSTLSGVTEHWDMDGDNACDDASGSVVQWSFRLPGAYRITLCASDANGSGSRSRTVTVTNRPPVAAITFAPAAPFTGDHVLLSSVSADPDGPLVSQAWDLDGDGAFDDAAGSTASWAFAGPGPHAVALLVADMDGATAVARAAIAVRERPPEPIAPFPVVSMVAEIGTHGTTIHRLVVKAPRGATVRVRCRGHGCPFRHLVRKPSARARGARVIRIRRFERRPLAPGSVVVIRVTKRGEVGKYTRFRVRPGNPPARADRCLMPGRARPVRCASG